MQSQEQMKAAMDKTRQENALSPSDQKIVDNLREMFTVANDKDTMLFDEQILAIAKKVPGTDDKADMDRLTAMVAAEAELAKHSVDAASESVTWANEVAKKANEDEELIGSLNDYLTADEIRKRGPVPLLIELQRVYGEEMDAFPEVGSGPDPKGNRHVDLYKVVGQAQKGSRIRDFALSLAPAKEARERYNAVVGKVGEYADLDDKAREKLTNYWKNRQQNAIKLTRDAFLVHQKMKACNEITGIKVDFNFDLDGTLTHANKPIRVLSNDPSIPGHPLSYAKSAQEFIKVQPSAIQTEGTKNGGTPAAMLKAMIAAMGKTPAAAGAKKTEEKKAAAKKFKINTLADLEELFIAAGVAVQDKAIDRDFTKQVGSKTIDEAYVKTFGDLYYWMDAKMRYIQPIYDRLIDREATAATARREAEMDSQRKAS